MATGHQSLHSSFHCQVSACSPGGRAVSHVRGAHLKAGRSAFLTLGVVVMSSPAPPMIPQCCSHGSGSLSPQPYDSLPTSQTCFFQLRLPPYSSQLVMAERLRYAINNCRSIDMDNYMLSRNVDNAEGSDTDY